MTEEIEEKTEAHFKIEEALGLIRNHCFNAYLYVLKSLSLINLKKTSHKGSFISSRSKSDISKWCQIDNVLAYDILDISMALIHEAIHNHVWILEKRYPIFKEQYRGKSWRVISPWPGDEITIGAYAHAVLVWFGLLSFLSYVPISEKRSYHINFIELGFDSEPFAKLENIASNHLESSYQFIRQTLNIESPSYLS